LREFNFPRNLYNLSKGYFSNRTVALTMNNVSETRRITKGCSQGSCCEPGFWNVLYNSLSEIELTNNSQTIAFAGHLIVLTRGDKVVEAENYLNIQMKKIMQWATKNRLMFNENKSRTMLMSCRRRKEKKEIEIYVNKTIIKQKIKYHGIIFDIKLTFRDHIKYIEE